MNYIEPKYKKKEKVEFMLSQRTKVIINYYAKYTGYDESEVVDTFMKNVLSDKEFNEWLGKQRNRKKIDGIIFNKNNHEQKGSD